MFLQQFVNQQDGKIQFSRQQACRFAKEVATDFNPIHDANSKRFCVPGDLLFAYLVSQHGLASELECTFSGMVGSDLALKVVQQDNDLLLSDDASKHYVTLQRQGALWMDKAYIEALVKDYVRFSGQNFPHILQPLMKAHQVMINPQRPLVIYERMSLKFDEFCDEPPKLALAQCTLTVEGKRGFALLGFDLLLHGKRVGGGAKRMILSNLQPYDEAVMQQMVTYYNELKAGYRPG